MNAYIHYSRHLKVHDFGGDYQIIASLLPDRHMRLHYRLLVDVVTGDPLHPTCPCFSELLGWNDVDPDNPMPAIEWVLGNNCMTVTDYGQVICNEQVVK